VGWFNFQFLKGVLFYWFAQTQKCACGFVRSGLTVELSGRGVDNCGIDRLRNCYNDTGNEIAFCLSWWVYCDSGTKRESLWMLFASCFRCNSLWISLYFTTHVTATALVVSNFLWHVCQNPSDSCCKQCRINLFQWNAFSCWLSDKDVYVYCGCCWLLVPPLLDLVMASIFTVVHYRIMHILGVNSWFWKTSVWQYVDTCSFRLGNRWPSRRL